MTPERFSEILASMDRGDIWDRTAVELARALRDARAQLALGAEHSVVMRAERAEAALADVQKRLLAGDISVPLGNGDMVDAGWTLQAWANKKVVEVESRAETAEAALAALRDVLIRGREAVANAGDVDETLNAAEAATATLDRVLADTAQAAEAHDRRVRAEALESAVAGHSCARPTTTYHGEDCRPEHHTCGACLVCQIRARAADERGGR